MRETSMMGIDSPVVAALETKVKSLPFVRRIVLGVLSVEVTVVDMLILGSDCSQRLPEFRVREGEHSE